MSSLKLTVRLNFDKIMQVIIHVLREQNKTKQNKTKKKTATTNITIMKIIRKEKIE